MTAMLAVFVLLYSALLGCWALVCAARGAMLGLGYLGGLVLLELTLLVRAGIELARLVTASGGPHGEFGRGYAEPGVHAGYLLASIVVLPLVLTVTRTARGPTSSEDPAEAAEDDHPVDQSASSRGGAPAARSVEQAASIEQTASTERAASTEQTASFEQTESTAPVSRTREATGARRAKRREATWDALVTAVGCAAVAVVTIRIGMTGRPA